MLSQTTVMEEPDIECGGFTFVSNFDSGNLARVELVPKTTEGNANTTGKVSPAEDIPDFEFNIWTKPDCAGTEYENSNRTWFYFGIKGGAPFSLVKLNIVNLNKQSKMYSQGMAPVYRMVPGRGHWERIKDKPTFVSEDNVFVLSFKYRTLENLRAVTYFAFTYPYSYLEVQNMLKGIDARFKNLEDEPRISSTSLDDIYYHRECVCYSLEGRRIDLITISSRHLMGTEREPRLKNLFPDPSTPRPFRFLGKKVIFISARVHPGETPSSFVFNGLLNLLLSRDDTIATLLRKLYVFKLIPVLNPDGVARGHYRTDTRGVNLNRVYLNPSSVLHPSVFAARSLIRYYHHGREVEDETPEILCYPTDKLHLDDDGVVHSSEGPELSSTESSSPVQKDVLTGDSSCLQSDENKVPNVENQVTLVTVEEKKHENQVPLINADKVSPLSENPRTLFEYPQTICQENNNVFAAIRETLIRTVTGFCDVNNENVNNATISVKAEGLPDKALIIEGIPHHNCVSSLTSSSEVLTPNSHNKMKPAVEPEFGAELENQLPSSILLCENKDNSGSQFGDLNCGSAQSETNNKICTGISKTIIEPEESGLFLYIDLHGHASKKGIFMYGNHFENIADSVECMLLPKIMSLNNQNFHFTACNFTERNMYLRDRRDGMSREGSGRVAVLKTTGLVRSYTLECNYNTGRIVNVLPPCVRDCSKPVSVYVVPPKYSPQVFEEVGRALGVSILDLTGSNPWSRIPNSEFRTLSGIREWLKTNCIPEQIYAQKVLRNQKQMGMPPTNAQVVCVAGARAIRPSSSGSGRRVRITGSKQDCSYGRNRRLAPLMSKTSDSKLSRVKVPSSNAIAVLCALEKADDDSENTEDSERKENMSSFQIISPPQSPSNSRLTKALSGPKEKSGCGSSQRCSETSKKYLGNQSTNNCAPKQVLTVRTKCAPIGPLAGSSKSKLNTNLRIQKVSSVGPAGVQRKGNSSLSASGGRISKFRRGSLLKSSREGSLGHSSDAETLIETDVPTSVGGRKGERKGSKQGSLISARAGTSNEKLKYAKDERSVSDQLIIKQGPKRLKITPLKTEQHSDLIGIGKLKLKDICLVNVGSEKKLLAKYAHIDEPTNMIDDIASETFSEEDLIISWDENQQPEIVSFGCSQQNSPHVKSKIVHNKSASVSNIPKSSNLMVGTSKSEIQGPGPSVKVKYNTKSDKQNKNKGSHLSPIKPLKKSSSFGKKTNSEKKRSKVTLRNLASSVTKFRGSGNSESSRSLSVEKKRKKSKSKFS